ncbi:Phage terminase-like protein, large subunit, contains N-terminal HTH domain [Parageobacillus thermantarcticus]|uniref:Phage terminase-like protein, large subunit, contains N-terminal HTH domain n=1 Tax=Parageobacillus thermantarcticus TaxID=186116 RepID=A0A1I0TXC9_9BACL|nr:terminase TerL endonuclease subunit [Parageobacillus thermantarcticus]SFA55556.1 Phage terminase-like protein, large subunit, contains N-terminal HTH domain [Parageobacillus thermantarcticus]
MITELIARIVRYAEDIVDGRITACKKHKQACERFLKEIELIPNDDYPYYFDGDELYRFYRWARMFKHTKGVLAGQPIELTDFQLFVVGNIFCWKRKENDLRRFRKAYIQLARKNAKSQLLALIASYECFLSPEQSEVYIAGWGREQSSIVYNEVLSQIQSCSLLNGKYTDSYGRIRHKKSGSIIQPLSKEARKTGDGKNPSLAVIDEYHVHETSEIYDVLVSGMAARKNPLIVVITTAGFNLDSPCYTEYQYVSKILDPDSPIENDEYFVMICELDKDDDIKDERNWIKANPIVATYEEGMNFLRSELQTALDVPEKMRSFLTKNMNIWVDQKDNGYIPLDKWRACATSKKIDLDVRECYIGVDLSKKIDLTSISGVVPLGDGRFYVWSHSFIPEDTLAEKRRTDKVPYDLWVEQGWITVTPGAVVDYHFIQSYIKKLADDKLWDIKEICYDPYNATHFAQEMEAEGYTMVEIRQGIRTLSEPTKFFRELVFSGKIVHDDNPVLNWAVGNAVVRQDHNENIMLDKDKSTDRIDPLAAAINAMTRAMTRTETVDINEITEEYLKMMGW